MLDHKFETSALHCRPTRLWILSLYSFVLLVSWSRRLLVEITVWCIIEGIVATSGCPSVSDHPKQTSWLNITVIRVVASAMFVDSNFALPKPKLEGLVSKRCPTVRVRTDRNIARTLEYCHTDCQTLVNRAWVKVSPTHRVARS